MYHDSHNIFYRNPFGAVETNTNIKLRLELSPCDSLDDVSIKSVYIRLWKNDFKEEKIPMKKVDSYNNIYEVDFISPNTPMILWYYFIVELSNESSYYYGNNDELLGGVGKVYDHPPASYQITVYKSGFETPSWFKDAVVYQIFVDRFNKSKNSMGHVKPDSIFHKDWYEDPYPIDKSAKENDVCNDFFGGDLLGIIEKLDYLKSLGVSAIYLNPIFKAKSNHKYDTGDYMNIDTMFGENETFKLLCDSAERLGISIILDGVFSHTGSDSIYFNKYGTYDSIGAYKSKYSPYYSWYKFKDHPNDYECWWGVKTLPNVNELDAGFMDYIIENDESVISNWMGKGAQGWRLDVVDELPDEFLKHLRKRVKSIDKDAIIIGEVWEDASNKVSYDKLKEYLLGEEIDSAMNYPLRDGLIKFLLGQIDGKYLNSIIMSLNENYPIHSFYSALNIAGTHDTARIINLLGKNINDDLAPLTAEKEELAIKRLKLISLFQMTFPGAPCIYYGDEAGLQGSIDPFNRRTYPWGLENKYILNWYKKVTNIRNSFDMLRTGDFIPLLYEKDVYGYVRLIKKGRDVFGESRNNGFALVLFNRSEFETLKLNINLSIWNVETLYDILDDNKKYCVIDGILSINIPELCGMLLIR
jgi:4-alpha-glucanotransferase